MKMSNGGFLVLVLVILVTCSVAELATEFAEASDGGMAQLPCNLTPALPGDKVTMVLWYKGSDESPIYKYDPRAHSPHWAEPELKKRFFLRILDDQKAVLTISPTLQPDEATFHCRVDFAKSPTKITHVNLTIIVAATGVQVSDDRGIVRNGMTSAYAEGASMTMTCVAIGGKPLPKVAWYKDNQLLTDETQYFADRKRSQAVLKIEKLTRAHLLNVYSCEVSNSKLQPPLVVRTAVDMYLRPLEVKLLGRNTELSAGRKYNITCKCKGSRPPANITWWKDGLPLEGAVISEKDDLNTTTSTLLFTPTASDHGLILSCKASNQMIPLSELQQTWMLKVLYPPRVTLTLGHGLDADDIKEDADVYFECHLIANPWVHRVSWLRDGERLQNNPSAGIIVSNQTLVLQGVSRLSSGKYCCEATNREGTTKSPPFHLKVKFEPVCGDVGRRTLGAAKDEPLKVECKVEAEPAATKFHWSFNSTPGISRELNDFTNEVGSSVLTYIPRIAADYGTLQCWGRNEIGDQRIPCTYVITPASKPEAPHSCLTNVTHHSVEVMCKKGYDGGLRQRFVLSLVLNEVAVLNVTSGVAEFHVPNLEAAQDYVAVVRAVNVKGASKDVVVGFRTLPAPGLKEQRRSTEPSEEKSTGPWLYILLAAGCTLFVAAAIGAIIFAIRRFKVGSPVRSPRLRNVKVEESPLNPRVPPPYTDPVSDDKNPDLIPPSNELMEGSIVPYTITARPSQKRNSATQMPVKPYHVTWAPILQSRNCATQTPPPHKESSV